MPYHGCGNGGLDVFWDLKGKVLVCAHVTGKATLGNGTIFVWCAVGVDRVGAVVFLVGLAVVAGQIGLDLSADTDTVSNPTVVRELGKNKLVLVELT